MPAIYPPWSRAPLSFVSHWRVLADMARHMSHPIPDVPRALGLAGLIPQGAALLIVISQNPAWVFTAQSLAFIYACVIFSFLGGMWWGIAAMMPRPPGWLWLASVVPSLLAVASAWPWATGTTWPGPSLILLGIGIILSLAVDRRIATLPSVPAWWMPLRTRLSLGLGFITMAIGWLSLP